MEGTVKERLDAFDRAFKKLKANREKVPLEILRTKYAAPYEATVKAVLEGADWFADEYIRVLDFPRHPADKAGNEWLQRKIDAIIKQGAKPGGLVEQYWAALIDRLDRDEYETLVWKRYDRLLREAFDPYWQRHNRWTGKPGNRWIYNDIFKKFWHPPCEKYPSGGWINSDYTGWDGRFPPNIGDDPEKENKA